MARLKRNKQRFYAYECPECGALVEFMMEAKKHDAVYESWCHVCGNEMRRSIMRDYHWETDNG